MARHIVSVCSLLLAVTLTGSVPAMAQSVVDSRTEVLTTQMVPMGTSASVRDGAPIVMSGNVGTAVSGSFAVVEEAEFITIAFQIPDFDPNDLGRYLYYFGMFSESGNGSGTAYPDRNGYVEYELHQRPGMEPMKTFLYAVHVETGAVEVFIDQSDISLNTAVMVLTNLQINANPRRVFDSDAERIARMARHFGQGEPEIGTQRRLDLYGNYLSLEDLQEQIFQQTRCNVELDVDVFYIASCS